MVKINIVCIGKIKDKYIKDGIDEFRKRLSKYVNLSVIELAEENDNRSVDYAITRETDRIIDTVIKKSKSYNILLDLKGEMKTSEEMALKLEKISLTNSEINFIIGGSNGVGDKLRQIVDCRLKFSSMTFPHQLMRLILIEQIYRWITINKNIKYHK
ncbi:MAG: 23S rRNA (pseudouridine(1915)-N(3))-methyltransferase RlmH [Leptotrichiaceae bacterium]|nr:23S rRNA (pseudouridine(1915)-N(3))-methyltransferase RlmH [Leptotrichiaceae bacterium]MBP6281572.1 23S rRNA (pseudouridine(1915)-N(3))-methyltransferase RlmH [Leptotrichiaceae bacterium]MBP7101298.1 23S rRNA (pseudouridine(1915)-N(3))-methyltransferase RlmH [Leptotrichiaceae bacterium]MBP7739650.1 23S rRNA (pseudouridine(1915)-N(3))-methyltransferase RlmH [Leptotrichiaceae bacterium]MBP9630484.1 23S rRNA (pseudouridine(1915)-N(3))-methyltransferase RlmH [Leptotrichiaceae bacterium]